MKPLFSLVVALLVGCGPGSPGASDCPPPDPEPQPEPTPVRAGDGWHLVSVPLSDGSQDEMWLYASSMGKPGPLPVAIFGHGQGVLTIANCWPDGHPQSSVVLPAVQFADALAEKGFLGVAIFYRNVGSGAPPAGRLKARGTFHDARAFLAAARWARDEHGAGSANAAFIGSSFGTYGAFWAVSPEPDLAELQSGLSIKTMVLAGHAANTLASGEFRNLANSPSVSDRAAAALLAATGIATALAESSKASSLAAADLRAGTPLGNTVSRYLTDRGVALVERTLISPANPALPGCGASSRVAPLCNSACLASTYSDLVAPAPDSGPLTNWLTPEAAEAVLYDPANGDPGANTPNGLLAAFRQLSPVYTVTGPTLTSRALLLMSTNDDVVVSETPHGLAQLRAALGRLGIGFFEPPISSDAAGTCEHDSYMDPHRGCGFDAIVSELQDATR